MTMSPRLYQPIEAAEEHEQDALLNDQDPVEGKEQQDITSQMAEISTTIAPTTTANTAQSGTQSALLSMSPAAQGPRDASRGSPVEPDALDNNYVNGAGILAGVGMLFCFVCLCVYGPLQGVNVKEDSQLSFVTACFLLFCLFVGVQVVLVGLIVLMAKWAVEAERLRRNRAEGMV